MTNPDLVTRLIRHCLERPENAEALFNRLILNKGNSVNLSDGTITLNKAEHDEFVARYSAEVEPTLWESKRRKL